MGSKWWLLAAAGAGCYRNPDAFWIGNSECLSFILKVRNRAIQAAKKATAPFAHSPSCSLPATTPPSTSSSASICLHHGDAPGHSARHVPPAASVHPKTLTPKLPLTPCCAVCGPKQEKTTPLSTCSRCKAVAYCGRDHQKEDFESHKHVCRYVQKCRKKMNAAEEQLPAELFTERGGHFWWVLETRPFMSAKRDYMLALTVTRTFEGVSLALQQGLDCLRLSRVDNLGIRDAVPALMLQIGQLQECYDFIKWWATHDPNGTVDLQDLSTPMYTVKNARMTEKIPDGFFSGPTTSVFHWAALAFIKIEVAFEAVTAVDMKEEADAQTPGLLDVMMSFLTSMPMSSAIIGKQCKRMKNDAADAIAMANEMNPHYWPCVLDPHSLSGDMSPGYYKPGDCFEVQSWLVPHGLLWSQDPIRKDFIQMFLNGTASE